MRDPGPMILCEVPECSNEASGRCSQVRYSCGKVYCIKHYRAVEKHHDHECKG